MASITEHQGSQVTRMVPPNDDIRAMVDHTEKLVAWVPLIILAVLVGLPVITSLASLRLGAALFDGIIMFIIAGLVIRLVNWLIIRPIRTTRYKRAAKTLASQVQSVSEPVTVWRSWWAEAPGALAVTRNGHLIIVDRSTDYSQLWLDKNHIVNVSVEREATQITNTKHSGRFTVGGVSNGLFGGYSFGGRSRSVTQTVENAFLEIRYQFEANGSVYTAVVPYGTDRRAADELCAIVTRIEHAA